MNQQGDLISRAAADSMVCETIMGASQFATDIRDAICEGLDRLPAVDPAPVVHAYWRKDKQFDSECSNCECCAPFAYDRSAYESPFCPECGAKMDGKGETK